MNENINSAEEIVEFAVGIRKGRLLAGHKTTTTTITTRQEATRHDLT
jgi:hypothetical protein